MSNGKYWNYRLVKSTKDVLGETETYYAVHEIVYKDNVPYRGTEDPSFPLGTTLQEFQDDLNAFIRAASMPVLEWNESLKRYVEVK